MNRLIRVGFFAIAVAVLAGVSPAYATITVEVNPAVSYQQTINNPCVIGDSSCKQPEGMLYTQYAGTPLKQGDPYDAYSPTYTYTQLVGFLSGQTSFQIGIDENYSTGAGNEILADLTVWYCPTGTCTAYAANFFDPPTGSKDAVLLAAGYSVLHQTTATYDLAVHNGNGYSDALSSTISIAGLTTAQFVFEGAINNDTDGMEEFFLIPAGAPGNPIPEPATMALFGTGLVSLGLRVRRRLRK